MDEEHRHLCAVLARIPDLIGYVLIRANAGHFWLGKDTNFIWLNAKVIAVDDARRGERGDLVEKLIALSFSRDGANGADGRVDVKEKAPGGLVKDAQYTDNVDHVNSYGVVVINNERILENVLLIGRSGNDVHPVLWSRIGQVHADQAKVLCQVVGANVGAGVIAADVEVLSIGLLDNRLELQWLNVILVKVGVVPRRVRGSRTGKYEHTLAIVAHNGRSSVVELVSVKLCFSLFPQNANLHQPERLVVKTKDVNILLLWRVQNVVVDALVLGLASVAAIAGAVVIVVVLLQLWANKEIRKLYKLQPQPPPSTYRIEKAFIVFIPANVGKLDLCQDFGQILLCGHIHDLDGDPIRAAFRNSVCKPFSVRWEGGKVERISAVCREAVRVEEGLSFAI